VIKYEAFSPVIVALQEDRMEPENVWMDDEYIEEDSKVVGKGSTKLFTLSALTQAYSFSALGDGDPITNPNAEMFRLVGERLAFVRAYWKRISGVFGALWVPPDPDRPGDFMRGLLRARYLEQRRIERNVAFQPVFLLALGRVGFVLGRSAGWAADAPVLGRLSAFSAERWQAYTGDDADGRDVIAYDPKWVHAMMRPRMDRDGTIESFAFEHSTEKIRGTQELLLKLLGVDPAQADAV
jgi:hypothetical protein